MGKTMEEKIDLLKKKLSSYGTKDIQGMISLHYASYGNGNEINTALSFSSDLLSPYQQQLYLAGLLVSTDEVKRTGSGKLLTPDRLTVTLNRYHTKINISLKLLFRLW